jgi:hypothetical protein
MSDRQVEYCLKLAHQPSPVKPIFEVVVDKATELASEIISRSTLTRQARMGLKDRVIDLNQRHPGLDISYSKLRRLYKQHKISFKSVQTKCRKRKKDTDKLIKKDWRLFIELQHQLRLSQERDYEVIYVDEAVFT